jgi:hypothetical protein
MMRGLPFPPCPFGIAGAAAHGLRLSLLLLRPARS